NRPEYWNGDVPWVSLHDSKLLDVDEVTKTSLAITELGLLNSSARLLPQGTVIFSRTATIGKSSVLGCPMATSQDFANYVCGPEVYNHFLVRLFRFMEKDWKRLMAGSTHNTIYMPVFKKLRVTIPKFEEQVAIVDHLRSLETETRLLEDKIAKARLLKQAMMQQLLTGRIRLV
ncbi:restriction endonuclease subunit S, partial [Rhodopirellula sp. JC639]|uniref:restriction endonuclease subunit S n=1 Tax=Stieleria mannarensis TaxID=2755585 RepID=UPI0016003B0D